MDRYILITPLPNPPAEKFQLLKDLQGEIAKDAISNRKFLSLKNEIDAEIDRMTWKRRQKLKGETVIGWYNRYNKKYNDIQNAVVQQNKEQPYVTEPPTTKTNEELVEETVDLQEKYNLVLEYMAKENIATKLYIDLLLMTLEKNNVVLSPSQKEKLGVGREMLQQLTGENATLKIQLESANRLDTLKGNLLTMKVYNLLIERASIKKGLIV